MWGNPFLAIIGTIAILTGAILAYRALDRWRMKRYIRQSRKQHHSVQFHSLPKLADGSIFVLFSDLEYPDYQAMQHSLLSYAEHLGDEVASRVYRRNDDDEASVLG